MSAILGVAERTSGASLPWPVFVAADLAIGGIVYLLVRRLRPV